MANNNPYQELDNLGRSIQEIIDKAINSQDYQELSRNIGRTIDNAINTGSQAVRNAVSSAGTVRKTHTVYTVPKYSAPEKKNLPALYGSPNGETAKGILKTVFGSLASISGFTVALVTGILKLVGTAAAYMTVPICLGGAALVGGVCLLTSGIRSLGKVSRFKVYLKTLGQRTNISLEKLARSVGKPVKFVRKEISGMIDQGLFLEGHMDKEEKNLITSDETYNHYQQVLQQQEALQLQKAREEAFKPVPAQKDAKIQEVLDRGNAYVQQIRKCNDEIPGEEISGKIYRMEAIVQRIFQRAEAHPEIIPDLKKLMDYYLPMTVKLLNAYAEMDRQPVQGENIRKSKQEIDSTLDTLNQAFEKLLDSVFEDTAMDVSSDISVLNTLLAQEGLTGSDFDQKQS